MLRKLHVSILCALLATLSLGGLAQAGSTTADVTLRVAPEGFVVPSHHLVGNDARWLVDPVEDRQFNDEDGIAGCRLTVPDTTGDGRIDGGEVLDHATADGCIVGWDSVYFSCCGRAVTAVDGLRSHGATDTGWPTAWWLVQVDGHASDVGIDQMDLSDGQDLSFVYYTGP